MKKRTLPSFLVAYLNQNHQNVVKSLNCNIGRRSGSCEEGLKTAKFSNRKGNKTISIRFIREVIKMNEFASDFRMNQILTQCFERNHLRVAKFCLIVFFSQVKLFCRKEVSNCLKWAISQKKLKGPNRGQSYKRNFVLKRTKLVLNS